MAISNGYTSKIYGKSNSNLIELDAILNESISKAPISYKIKEIK